MNFISQNVFLIVLALVSGGMLLWHTIRGRGGAALGSYQATQFMNQGAQVIDLRSDADFRAGHLPGARQAQPDAVLRAVEGVEQGKSILVVCADGSKSARAVAALKGTGRQIHTLEGGMDGWKQAGLPLVTSKK
ncbi:MAG: rhodanese-like domain-containing protein [Lautropia sp.]|nr:rhodanese-like domain-containing protein [Lautropia sp.]